MQESHPIIVIPGLGDKSAPLIWASRDWKNKGFEVIVHSIGWGDGEDSFTKKLSRITSIIDSFARENRKASLIGTSAGGSAVINAFIARKDAVRKVINICGRTRIGPTYGWRSYDSVTRTSPSFRESLRLCEEGQVSLTSRHRKRILNIRPLLGDELVPSDTAIIPGAKNITIPMGEHMISIMAAMTIYSSVLLDFIREE